MNGFEVPVETRAAILAGLDKVKTSSAAMQLISDHFQRQMAASTAALGCQLSKLRQSIPKIQLPRVEFPAIPPQLMRELELGYFQYRFLEAAGCLEDKDLDGFFESLKGLQIQIYPNSHPREALLEAFWIVRCEVVDTPKWKKLKIKKTIPGYVWTCIIRETQELLRAGHWAIEPEIIDANNLKPWPRRRLEQLAPRQVLVRGPSQFPSDEDPIARIGRRELLVRVAATVTPTQREIIRLCTTARRNRPR